MKFFIDTANLAHIKEAHELGVLDGVTTNPSLMAKEGISGHDNVIAHYKAICEITDGDVSAEVIATTYDEMITEGEALDLDYLKPPANRLAAMAVVFENPNISTLTMAREALHNEYSFEELRLARIFLA